MISLNCRQSVKFSQSQAVTTACLLFTNMLVADVSMDTTSTGQSDENGQITLRWPSNSLTRDIEMSSFPSIDATMEKIEAEPPSSGEWLIAPVPGYSPVLGVTLAGAIAKIYRPAGTSKDSPAWITGGAVFATQNGSWGLGLGQKMNLGDDRWRINGGIAYADVRYRYYGIGNDSGDVNRYVPLRQTAPIVTGKMMYRVSTGWYVGAQIAAANSTTYINANDLPPEVAPPPEWDGVSESIKAALNTITPTIEYDSRDSDFFPRQGILFRATGAIFSDLWGSDFNFEIYSLAYNHYFPFGDRGVLAVRTYARVGAGNVPFFALSTLGQGSDIRGYTPGRYRDKALVSGQVEYRHELSQSWCVAAFFGMGAVGPSIGDIPRALPAGGFGVRYRLTKESKASIRVDVAWGRDDNAFYISMGEAF